MDATARQRDHRRPVADVLAAADERTGGHANIVEADVGGPGAFLAHLGVLGADHHACGVGGHEKHRDARAVVVGRSSAREDDEKVGRRRIGDEALLAGDHPICVVSRTVANGFRAQSRRVRAGARFGEREGGDDVTGGHRLEPARLLLVGAEPDEHLSGDAVVGAEHRAQRQRCVAQFHGQFDVLCQVQAQPAPLLRDRVAEQAHLLGVLAQVVGDPVVGEDLLLSRHDGGAHEVASLGQDLLEIVVADFCRGHRQMLLSGEWRPMDGEIIYEI